MFMDNMDRGPSRSEGAPRRRRGRPRGTTARGRETHDALYAVAVEAFAREGYEAATLRAIAEQAGVSPGLLYRYFPSKRAVVLALYDELSLAFHHRARPLQPGKWRDRFLTALETSLDVLRPHRRTLVALVPVLVGGRDEGLFAPATAFSRDRVQSVFVEAVTDASDAPRGDDAAALGRALDLVHLAVLLLWLLDRSEGQRATRRLVDVIRGLLPAFSLAYRLRVLRTLVRDLDEIARRAFHGPAAASAGA